ncbi:hypothetical protein E2562_014193 [Oryza meyeriana var. granulata]|uniref:Reverse transcriptase Ty1/copia-type domain-containing protein n=1 Tax=Oryza meyeriana var. granulata TaxID=110450 RepID=A0A6G1BKP7_9ORYZ|nr:hypothetical protein E2562_014193 [Oryza meyeriana var. granulata]
MEAGTDFVVEYPAMELGATRFDADTVKGSSNQTWRLVPLPPGHRPIGLKWVYKVKKNAAGEVIKHKARLVAKGYVQQPGMDFDEVFAPVARIESVRLLLALAAQEGWSVHHMDVKSAFLNGELIEEVYVRQPPGFTVAGHEDKVLRLDKALYGLRQAPRAWNAKLDETLVALGFSHSASEHAQNQEKEHWSSCSGDESNCSQVNSGTADHVATGGNGKALPRRGSATIAQSLYAMSFVPCNAEKRRKDQWWISAPCLKEAVHYVKFLQLQIKMLRSCRVLYGSAWST